MKKLLPITAALLSLPAAAFANTITDTQTITSGGAGSVGYTYFTQDATATTEIQTLTNNFDPYMYLFYDDGSLDSSDYIADDDDSGIDSDYDSFNNSLIGMPLSAGNYIVAVSDYYLSLVDAISGINTEIAENGTGYGSYDLQISSDANVSLNVPEPTTITLLGLGLLGIGLSRRKA
jgi:hypothetical protein